MKLNVQKIVLLIFFFGIVWSCEKDDVTKDDDVEDGSYNATTDQIQMDKKEIRAAWIATVSNLDWPITKGNADAQKSELTAQLSRCQTLNFNAVVFQVRPTADSFYPSSLEPWASYLTGVQGQDPGYDPLKYAVDEAHRMGMEFHAWLNPYRIGATSLQLASNHVALKNPSWVVTYNGTRYFNPGLPEVRAHLCAVVKDIITRYEVDAIHFDDYFYPSGAKSTSNPFGFDDKAAFEKYGAGKDIHAWRAENVNLMVVEIKNLIKATKPGVLFGISPSGRRENSIELYADPFVWLENKWVDYLAPQLYWEFGHATADFAKQSSFWNTNSYGVPMIIGLAAYKFKDASYPAYGTVSEFDNEIEAVRAQTNLSGCFFFRMRNLENAELYSFLKTKYVYKSSLPVMGAQTVALPKVPVITVSGSQLTWSAVDGAKNYVVYVLEKKAKVNHVYLAHAVQLNSELKFSGVSGKSYFVTALNEDQRESLGSTVVAIK